MIHLKYNRLKNIYIDVLEIIKQNKNYKNIDIDEIDIEKCVSMLYKTLKEKVESADKFDKDSFIKKLWIQNLGTFTFHEGKYKNIMKNYKQNIDNESTT